MANNRTDLDKVKDALRIPSSVTAYDDELAALLASAEIIAISAGVDLATVDPEIMTTLKILYAKGTFGARADAERSLKTFEAIIKQQALIRPEEA